MYKREIKITYIDNSFEIVSIEPTNYEYIENGLRYWKTSRDSESRIREVFIPFHNIKEVNTLLTNTIEDKNEVG